MIFKQAFRFAFVALIWKQYKQVIVSTLLLFFFLFLVGNIHSDFLEHAKIQKTGISTASSFIYKWLAYAAGVLIYFAYHYFRGSNKRKQKSIKEKLADPVPEAGDDDDPFAEIRTRKTLRGRADFLMEDKK